MSEADMIGVTLAIGVTVGAALWEWLRGDLLPRLWKRKFDDYETRLRELRDQLERVQGAS